MKIISKIRIAGFILSVTIFLIVMTSVNICFAEITSSTSNNTIDSNRQSETNMTPKMRRTLGRGLQHIPMVVKIASIIDMEVEDLIALRHEGKSFLEITTEMGIREEELIDGLMEEKRVFLNAQANQGQITTSQLEAIADEIEENLKSILNRKEVGPSKIRPNIGLNMSRDTFLHHMHGRRGRKVYHKKCMYLRD